MKRLAIIGAGGLAKEVYEIAIQSRNKAGDIDFFVSDEYWKEGLTVCDEPVRKLSELGDDTHFVICAIGDSKARARIMENVPYSLFAHSLIHPLAYVSSSAKIQAGSVVFPYAVVSAGADVGECNVINYGAVVGHDVVTGFCVTVSPGAVLCGNVGIGHESYIGAKSVIREKVTIAARSFIGMGAVVVRDITKENSTVVGNPARETIGKE